jgi:hypothetical protein
MPQPTLLQDGDSFEKNSWPALNYYFPHYELFWQLHIYPLRAKGTILLRDDVDGDFQLLAMRHYSTYVNLARANEKIESRVDRLRFFDEIYANLHRSCELAIKVVESFRNIHERCTGSTPDVRDSPLSDMEAKLRTYRNLIHEPLSAYVTGVDDCIRIPRREHMEKYRLWTSVLYHPQHEEFENIEVQLKDDFRALCSGLEQVWKEMCEASKSLCMNPRYIELQRQGREPKLLSLRVPGASPQTFATIVSRGSGDEKRY